MKVALFVAALSLFASPLRAAQTITAGDAWSRPAIDTGVVYFTIHNRGAVADRLIDAASPVAQHVEFHQTMSGQAMSGMTTEMHRLDSVSVPAGGTLSFAPGGYHIMLVGLRRTLTTGQWFPLRLRFARAGWIVVKSQVRGA